MAEYWKSTPKYWCKFCEIYVRDSAIERKNHEASAKHQNSIQRSLRDLHKGQAKTQRDQDKAKDEVTRLNKLVGTKSSSSVRVAEPAKAKSVAAPARNVDFAASHAAQMKQLAAMGIYVPSASEEASATGDGWQAVPESFVDVATGDPSADAIVKGLHKRKVDDEEDEMKEEESSSKRRKWGSSTKAYPGKAVEEDSADLDALLSGVSKKQDKSRAAVQGEVEVDDTMVKEEAGTSTEAADVKGESGIPAAAADIKEEDSSTAVTAPPIVAFKKRKGKR